MGRNYARMVDTGTLVLVSISCDHCGAVAKPGSPELRSEWTKTVVRKGSDRDERFWCDNIECEEYGDSWIRSNTPAPVRPMLHVAADGTANALDLWNTLRFLLGGRRCSSVELGKTPR